MEAPSGSDPVSGWTVRAGETGLEEPLGQLGFGGGAESYPERPDEADCRYYLRTGYCGYGIRCRFNHPRDRTMVMGAMRASRGHYPERLSQPVCQYYMKTGMCKFGASCRYHHPSQSGGSPMPTTLNIYGYPLRPSEKECAYYVKTGHCKFGVNCKFHHPQPAGVQVAAPVPGPAPVSPAASAITQPNVGASPGSSFPAHSGSSPMSDIFADLPQDVLSNIFNRLPVKSIGRSRCVSKPWLSLLTSYEFISAHLAHCTHNTQEQKLLLLCGSCLFSLTLHASGNHLRRLEFFDKKTLLVPCDSPFYFTLVGSCNGLVLVTTKRGEIWLMNCMTEECVKLPDSPFPLRQYSYKKYGFGYDSLSEDYKIVKISQFDIKMEDPSLNYPEIFVDIYSLKMRSWKRFGTAPYGHHLQEYDSCVFINGAFHWIAFKSSLKSTVIVAFNLTFEKFEEIPGPSVDKVKLLFAKLMVIDGCLGLVLDIRLVEPHFADHYAEKNEIWLLKSYSLAVSWTKLDTDIKPLCFHEDKILFHGPRPRDLNWYCLKDGRVEVCLSADDTPYFIEGVTYSESLVSPHFNYHNRE